DRRWPRTSPARPRGQRWGTFPRNHLPQIAAMDQFVVPTIGFNLLYVLVIVVLARRELMWINMTGHPTAASRPHYAPMAFATSPLQRARRAEFVCRAIDRNDP